MGAVLGVRVPRRSGQRQLLAEGNGVSGDAESEGSRGQSHDPMDKNPIRRRGRLGERAEHRETRGCQGAVT